MNDISISWGKDHQHPLRRYEYTIFSGEKLVARKGGFLTPKQAKTAGLKAAADLAEESEPPSPPESNREDFQNANGMARWWNKDGAWHIARPAPDPDPETGLRNGGFLWTGESFSTREEAVAALQ